MASSISEKEQIVIGVNWGGIKDKGWFGYVEYKMTDLDLYVLIVDEGTMKINEVLSNRETSESVFGNGIKIEKDDNQGDLKGNDEKDNEWARINLKNLPSNYHIIPIIHMYSKDIKWEELSHLEFRLYYGEPNEENRIINFQNILDKEIDNSKYLTPGYIFKNTNIWHFETFSLNEKNDLLRKIEKLGITDVLF